MLRMFKEASDDVDRLVRAVVLYVYHHSSIYREKRRMELSSRLHRVFFIDSLEGSLDVIVRGKYGRRV